MALRDIGFNPKTVTMNFIFMNGGMGDHVAALVAVDYVIKNYPWIRILLWVPDYMVEFAKHFMPDRVDTKGYSDMRGRYQPTKPTKTTEWDLKISPMRIHLVDYAFLKFIDDIPPMEYKNYLQIDPTKLKVPHLLPDKYVVVTTGYTSNTRTFLPEQINLLSTYIQSKGYEVVFLGQTTTKTGSRHLIEGKFDEKIDFSQGLNLIDKTTMLEAAAVINDAKAIVGIDNGLMHIAGCTQTPIVGGFTTVNPESRWPIRNNILGDKCYLVEPETTLQCRFCQCSTNFLFGHDYRDCIYKDFKCVQQMTADKFIVHLEKLL